MIRFVSESCGLTEEGILDRIGATDLTMRLEGIQGDAKVEASYSDFMTLAPEVFLMSKSPNYCGQMEVIFDSNDSFISFDEVRETVILEPELSDEVGIHTKSVIRFRMVDNPHLAFTVTIEATILECRVTKSSFARD